MTPVLIVEDEEKLARVLELELKYEGYETETALDGQRAFQLLESGTYQLVLLDIMLPGMSGLEVLRRFRKINQHTPVILLTARDEVHDKVSGLDLGANDYVTKPFQMEELLARVRVHLRTNIAHNHTAELLTFDDLTIDTKSRDVKRGSETIELTPREYDLLTFLLKNKNQVFHREQLLDKVWGFDYVGDTNVVDVYIRYVRNKIDKPFQKTTIQTVRGIGYTVKDPLP
ncbi:DNA-binding response regulator, OmpR family, contains REC and winged-helix (wHTH) domain [Gracilibacillus ureilyticus]|uniref:DNA-binding response regulator, OmpR family, contains REC and winged-helix (WHTH) domain n=1 Tax=Gracilibacillus ureilyticus TaxID=531814 RepID=A0A1H9VL13_9BACI|nr:response regulator transcription factor [Gracilibacillus ureilyticus]SES22007.1 DNA-binding response regulator, OmpR family, contains REC and winged-helix (wHTH) domain [Gracilibacillus ureilyticus]